MSPQKKTIEAYVDAFNAGDIAALDALFTPDAQVHNEREILLVK